MIVDKTGFSGVLQSNQFELGLTLGSGQVFRWGRDRDGWWKGIVYGVVIWLKQTGEAIHFKASSDQVVSYAGTHPISEFIGWYLRLETSPRIRVAREDLYLRKARAAMKGMRFVRQDPFECIISYVLSVQAHMALTKRRIHFISRTAGNSVDFMGRRYWAFPKPERLAALDGSFFRQHRFGWRSERVADSASFVACQISEKASVSLAQWREINDALLNRAGSGVGLKVAKCIDLFSLERLGAVPVDTWVRQFAENWYGVTGSDAKICAWAEKRWGKWAGYCNEYLFSYYRELNGPSIYDRVLTFNASDEPSQEMPFDDM
jgi:N-glycosylase/DNA lyase